MNNLILNQNLMDDSNDTLLAENTLLYKGDNTNMKFICLFTDNKKFLMNLLSIAPFLREQLHSIDQSLIDFDSDQQILMKKNVESSLRLICDFAYTNESYTFCKYDIESKLKDIKELIISQLSKEKLYSLIASYRTEMFNVYSNDLKRKIDFVSHYYYSQIDVLKESLKDKFFEISKANAKSEKILSRSTYETIMILQNEINELWKTKIIHICKSIRDYNDNLDYLSNKIEQLCKKVSIIEYPDDLKSLLSNKVDLNNDFIPYFSKWGQQTITHIVDICIEKFIYIESKRIQPIDFYLNSIVCQLRDFLAKEHKFQWEVEYKRTE